MKRYLVAGLVLAGCLLSGCDKDTNREAVQQAYQQGYQQGATALAGKIRQESTRFRGGVREKMSLQLLWLTLIYVAATFYGAKIAEGLREFWQTRFKLPTGTVIQAVRFGYWTSVIIAPIVSITILDVREMLPTVILAGATYPPYRQYLAALEAEDKPAARNALTRLKSLAFFLLVLLIIYSALSENGVLGIKLSK